MQEKILGDYRLVRQLGAGTLGSVWLAEHRFIKKNYVLKILPEELCQDPGFIQRFEEEIANLSNLDHPHIVKVHNVSFADGVYFLVTDCIVDAIKEMTNLAQYMSGTKGRLREEELLSVLRQIADALDYAHTTGGVVHRALKLSNILIGQGSLGLNVFISDFGLAKIISSGKIMLRTFNVLAESLALLPEESVVETYCPSAVDGDKLSKLSHSFLQSYAFLSPEQKRCENVGVQTDTYAFGVLAYFLIAGHFPEGKFLMPSEIAPEYHYDWDSLVAACLAQDPARRPTQLLPLLERKKEERQQYEEPLLFVQSSALRQPAPVVNEREEPSLKPIIQRVVEKQPEAIPAPVLVTVTAAEAMETTTYETEESFAGKLNAMLNRDPIVTQYLPEKKESREIEPIQTEMVIVRSGQFFRGSNCGNRDETPRHKIYLNNFAMDIHAVTNEQFVRFLEFTGGEKDQNYNDIIRLKDSRIMRSGGRLSIESGYSKHPVVGVTWYGAISYAKWAGKRLPTEAEWEVAACGRVDSYLYPTGDVIEKVQANFFSSDTTSVMSYPPNKLGLYDMAGNVYEWCQDWYGYNYYETSAQEPNNPKGPPQGVYRVLRGGCWKSLHDDMRCSHRHRNNPGTVNSTYGFRCAADVSN